MTQITLIRTTPPSLLGSMPAIADLVKGALSVFPELEVRTIDFFDPAGGDSMRRHHLWRVCHTRSFFEKHPAGFYHLLDGSMAGFLPSKVWKKTGVTVHDLIPFLQCQGRLHGAPGLVGRVLIHRTLRALREVAGVATVSNHTAKDVLDCTGRADVSVIHNPVRPLPSQNKPSGLPSRYLFHIGNNAEYKNRRGVLDVFAKLQDMENLHLIMAGSEPSSDLRKKANALERVQFRINVTDAELSALYASASVFLFPSLYEGFGMPVLEAMQAGCPVVCSDVASLPEVVGDAAWIAPAENIEGLADHCRCLLESSERRNELIQKGQQQVEQFSMDHFSRSLREWYRTLSVGQGGDSGCNI